MEGRKMWSYHGKHGIQYSVQLVCSMELGHNKWANMHDTRTLRLKQLNGIQPHYCSKRSTFLLAKPLNLHWLIPQFIPFWLESKSVTAVSEVRLCCTHRQISTSWSSSGQLHSYRSLQLAWLWFIRSPSRRTDSAGSESHALLNRSTRAASPYTCLARWCSLKCVTEGVEKRQMCCQVIHPVLPNFLLCCDNVHVDLGYANQFKYYGTFEQMPQYQVNVMIFSESFVAL